MIKFLIFRIVRAKVRKYLPLINVKFYNKLFILSYKFFTVLKPSQIWVIILALLNKTEFKKLVSLPSMLVLFNTLFLDSSSNESKVDSKLNTNMLFARLESNKFTDSDNNW